MQFSESADNGFHNGVDHAFDIEFRMRNQTKCHTVNKSHIHFHHHLDFFIGNFRRRPAAVHFLDQLPNLGIRTFDDLAHGAVSGRLFEDLNFDTSALYCQLFAQRLAKLSPLLLQRNAAVDNFIDFASKASNFPLCKFVNDGVFVFKIV